MNGTPYRFITAELVCGFLAWHVLDKQNASHALPDTLSNLRVAAKAQHLWRLSADEEDQVAKTVSLLQ